MVVAAWLWLLLPTYAIIDPLRHYFHKGPDSAYVGRHSYEKLRRTLVEGLPNSDCELPELCREELPELSLSAFAGSCRPPLVDGCAPISAVSTARISE